MGCLRARRRPTLFRLRLLLLHPRLWLLTTPPAAAASACAHGRWVCDQVPDERRRRDRRLPGVPRALQEGQRDAQGPPQPPGPGRGATCHACDHTPATTRLRHLPARPAKALARENLLAGPDCSRRPSPRLRVPHTPLKRVANQVIKSRGFNGREALAKDFGALQAALKAEGFYDPSPLHVLYRVVRGKKARTQPKKEQGCIGGYQR